MEIPETSPNAATPPIAAAPSAEPAPSSSSAMITLMEPIERKSGQVIDKLLLKKPRAGDLRGGLKVEDLFAGNVDALLTVVPRIATPFITMQEAEMLSTEDLMEVAGTVRGFFLPPSIKAALAQMGGG